MGAVSVLSDKDFDEAVRKLRFALPYGADAGTVLRDIKYRAERSLVLTKRWRDRLVGMRERITTLEKTIERLERQQEANEAVLVALCSMQAPGPNADQAENRATTEQVAGRSCVTDLERDA